MRSLRPFADRILEGTLNDRLRAWRAEGLSYHRIARELANLDHEVDVTAETVRQWCIELEVPA